MHRSCGRCICNRQSLDQSATTQRYERHRGWETVTHNGKDIRIAWRKWLSMRVKIVDEYNRIPTRTRSALRTVMGDNYAELLDQIHECTESAWFLTANDEQRGGTYHVIETLRDRIDVIVQPPPARTAPGGWLCAVPGSIGC